MRARTHLGIFLLRMQSFFNRLVPVFLTPETLTELNRLYFSSQRDYWIEEGMEGLTPMESKIIAKYMPASGKALCLGTGGGREAIALAEKKIAVTGVEYVPELVAFSRKRAEEGRYTAKFVQQDILDLNLNGELYDAAFMFNINYSYIPSQRQRTRLLQKIFNLLRPGGILAIHFLVLPPTPKELRYFPLFKFLALLSGNPEYECGIRVHPNCNFIHAFPSLDSVKEEVTGAGFLPLDSFEEGQSLYLVLTHEKRN